MEPLVNRPNICAECAYYNRNNNNEDKCRRVAKEKINLITGHTYWIDELNCARERNDARKVTSACGPKGKHWKSSTKPALPSNPSKYR